MSCLFEGEGEKKGRGGDGLLITAAPLFSPSPSNAVALQ